MTSGPKDQLELRLCPLLTYFLAYLTVDPVELPRPWEAELKSKDEESQCEAQKTE